MHGRQYAKSAGYILSLGIPALPFLGYQMGSAWLTPMLFFFVLPFLGRLLGSDTTPRLDPSSVPSAMRHYHRWLPRLYFPVWLLSLLWTVTVLSNPHTTLSVKWGLGFSAAIGSASASAICHELMHSEARVDAWVARLMISLMGYPHFIREHFYHHRHVGIPGRGLSALVGESLWSFLQRVLPEGFRAASRLESEILIKRRKSILHSSILQNGVLVILWAALFLSLGGMAGLAFFLLQAAFSIFAIQAINYIQHYGLVRLPGEPIGHELSWEDNCPIANCLTLNINHHSHHHMAPNIPYFALELDKQAPRLPGSYLIMLWIALLPPIWRKVMDSRLMAYLKQHGGHMKQKDGDCLGALGDLMR